MPTDAEVKAWILEVFAAEKEIGARFPKCKCHHSVISHQRFGACDNNCGCMEYRIPNKRRQKTTLLTQGGYNGSYLSRQERLPQGP
jgi:hypothetical protein